MKVTYTTSTFVGGNLDVDVKITNKGTAKSEPIKFQFGGLKDHADLVGCSPTCSENEFFGDIFTQFTEGVGPGKTKTFSVRWLPTEVGVVNWSLLAYNGAVDDIFYGEGSTVIR